MSSLAIAELPVYSATGALGSLMPTGAPSDTPKPKRETWKDWILPGYVVPTEGLITREELFAILQAWDVDVDVDDIRNWQAQGVIPYGVRTWHPETGRTRVVYPKWMAHVLAEVRRLQGRGEKLQDIRPVLLSVALRHNPRKPGGANFFDFMDSLDCSLLTPALKQVAEECEELLGRRVVSIQASLELDPSGKSQEISIQIDDERGARFTSTSRPGATDRVDDIRNRG